MTMWQSGGMGGPGNKNNAWMKLMGIVQRDRRTHDHQQGPTLAERGLNQ